MRLELRCGFTLCVTMQRSGTSMVWFEVRANLAKTSLNTVFESSLTTLAAMFASATITGTRRGQPLLTHMTCPG